MSLRNLAKYGPIPLFFLSFLATVSEFSYIDRTIGSARLFSIAAGVGMVAVLLLFPIFSRRAFINEPLGARVCYFLILGTAFAAMSVYFTSILNRAFSPETSVSKTFNLVSKGHYGKGNVPFIEVALPDGVERFDVSPSVWSSITNRVCLDISPGNLKFDRVVRIKACDRSNSSLHTEAIGSGELDRYAD